MLLLRQGPTKYEQNVLKKIISKHLNILALFYSEKKVTVMSHDTVR